MQVASRYFARKLAASPAIRVPPFSSLTDVSSCRRPLSTYPFVGHKKYTPKSLARGDAFTTPSSKREIRYTNFSSTVKPVILIVFYYRLGYFYDSPFHGV